MEVSIQEPQLQPPPPSGESNIPPAGIVLSQQSGRKRGQSVFFPLSGLHIDAVLAGINVPLLPVEMDSLLWFRWRRRIPDAK